MFDKIRKRCKNFSIKISVAVKKNEKYISRRLFCFFFHHSASKYKNAESCVQRDDSSFRQRLHYSEGFREECGWWGTTRWKGERSNVRGRMRRWLFDGVSESWKFHNGLWWARLKVHWRFSGRKDTESGWGRREGGGAEYEAGSKPFRPLDVFLFRVEKRRKVPSPHSRFPALRTLSLSLFLSLEMNEGRDLIIPRIEKPNAELTVKH